MAGLSRMSSVPALKASPHTATRRPVRSGPSARVTLRKRTCFCRSFTASTAARRSNDIPTSRADWISAFTSLGKQDPPYPGPGKRNAGPIRRSVPIPCRTIFTSAPTCSQNSAIWFMNEIRVASIALAAYLVTSAEARSMKRIGLPVRTKGA